MTGRFWPSADVLRAQSGQKGATSADDSSETFLPFDRSPKSRQSTGRMPHQESWKYQVNEAWPA